MNVRPVEDGQTVADQQETPAFSFRPAIFLLSTGSLVTFLQFDFHSRAAKEDFKWLVYLLCLHHSNNVLSFCPKLSDVLVNSKSISFKYDYKAACFARPLRLRAAPLCKCHMCNDSSFLIKNARPS